MRYKPALAAAGLLASSLVLAQPAEAAVPAATQQATATCSLVLPKRITIKAEMNMYWASLGSNCSASVYTAVWKKPLGVGDSADSKLVFNFGERLASFGVRGWNPPPGTLTFTPAGGATDANGTKIADLASATTVARWASVAAISGGRKGTRTALLTTVSRWDGGHSPRFIRWANKKVLLQYQEIGTSTWKGLAYVTTGAQGQVTYNYYPNRTRRYRAYVPATTSIWDAYSPTISR
ncbi:hypothetical protein [Kribbella catacumbae]|uniref:hypothetical protein n=1 Tax=Kribbella catacumbae TaxID=460086 RepID=UPI00035FB842|nr:hypothetical protein [Kribbella catacumbae]